MFKKQNIGRIFSVLFLIYLLFYLSANKTLAEPLLAIPVIYIIVICSLKFVEIFINGLFTKLILREFGKKIGNKESFYISLLSTIGNYFGPILGGAGIRAVYLKNKYKFNYSDFIGSLYGYYIISFLIISILGLISSLNLSGSITNSLSIFYSGILLFTLFLIFIRLPEKIIDNKASVLSVLYGKILLIQNGWIKIKQSKLLIINFILLGVTISFLGIIGTYLQFKSLGLAINIPAIVIYSTLSSLSILISITPGAIGVREAIFILVSSQLFLKTDDILQLSAIDRGATIIVLVLLYLVSQVVIFKRRINNN
ncbi:flippase-like domain-containing protein [Candidatus Berkelbacteria bacterium]|nr:flippase-like domain-containing protein [Candidatus Berkelbacteria bacterium]